MVNPYNAVNKRTKKAVRGIFHRIGLAESDPSTEGKKTSFADEESQLLPPPPQPEDDDIGTPKMERLSQREKSLAYATQSSSDIHSQSDTSISQRNRFSIYQGGMRRFPGVSFLRRKIRLRELAYEQGSHIFILFRMYGSLWPRVLPYCVLSVLWTGLVWELRANKIIDMTIDSLVGHQYMAILVSFLVVSRSNITYGRFMEGGEHLRRVYLASREIVQYAAITTQHDESKGAVTWRREVAYRTIAMLRVAMAAIDYRSSKVNTWDVLHDTAEKQELEAASSYESAPPHHGENDDDEGGNDRDGRISHGGGMDDQFDESMTNPIPTMAIHEWGHGVHSTMDENFRAPIILSYNLREAVMMQRNGKHLERRMHISEEMHIMNQVGAFLDAFTGLKKLITCPFPFPMVQMTRTFLFFWIYSLPLVLVSAMDRLWEPLLVMFFITYGFLGIEYMSMELDDPFGEDPNDFDNLGMAEIVFEDIYITIYKVDGMESARALREKVADRVKQGTALGNYHSDVARKEFWEKSQRF